MSQPSTHSWLSLRPWQRHSLVLAVAGFVYILIGLVYLLVDRSAAQRASMQLALELLPVQTWGCLWITVGCLALASTRWPPKSTTWGYTALSALSTGWGSLYVLGVVFDDVPVSAISGTLVWWLVAFMWWAISGLVNPDDMPLED